MPNSFEFTAPDDLLQDDPVVETPLEAPIEPVESPDNEPQEPVEGQVVEPGESEDFLTTFLKDYGITDGHTITFKNEDDSEEQIDFDSLDNSEKLNILRELVNPNLSQDEINVINYLRANNTTMQDVVQYYSQKAVQDYIQGSDREYTIDDYSDDELYIADLKLKYPDMSNEDIDADLENAKQNEALYQKKVGLIRAAFVNEEKQRLKDAQTARENQYNTFRQSVEDSVNGFNSISIDSDQTEQHVMQIEESEKAEVLRYLLQQDSDGATQFFKDLNDPSKLVKMAYLYKFGEQALSDVTNYFKSQLKTTRRQEKPVTTVRTSEPKRKETFTSHPNGMIEALGESLL